MPFAEPKPLPADLKSFPDDGKPGQGDGPEYLKKAKPPRAQFRPHKMETNYETPLQAENPGLK